MTVTNPPSPAQSFTNALQLCADEWRGWVDSMVEDALAEIRAEQIWSGEGLEEWLSSQLDCSYYLTDYNAMRFVACSVDQGDFGEAVCGLSWQNSAEDFLGAIAAVGTRARFYNKLRSHDLPDWVA